MIRILMILTVTLLGAACAMPPMKLSLQDPRLAAREQVLQTQTQWLMRGRMAIKVDGDGGSGAVSWRQSGAAFDVQFLGPLGTGDLRITGDLDGAIVRAADGQVYADRDVAVLVAQLTGWRLPVTHLPYWLRGLPVPDLPVVAGFDAAGQLAQIRQGDWHVEYSQWFPAASASLQLPRKLRIEHPDVTVKLLVSDWTLGGSE